MKKCIYCFMLLVLSAQLFAKPLLSGNSEGMDYVVEEVATGFEIPWGMAFVEKDKLLITERPGKVKLLNLQTGKTRPVSGIPTIFAVGQGGLLDVAVSPKYATEGWIYFTYVKRVKKQGVTVLARAKLAHQQLIHWQDLLVTQSGTNSRQHFGSRITFDERNHVFFTIGDRGKRPNGQDLSTHAGSVLRLHLDGQVPKDNPLQPPALREIWSYGHRNPQGIVYDNKHQRLWLIEHGPRGGDEINLIQPGKNYGWPVISYGKEYWGPFAVGEGTHKTGMEQPVKIYTPSIAPSSLILYQGGAFPAWQGNLLAGALKLQHINRVVLNTSGKVVKEQRLLQSLNERIRALLESAEGWIYVATDSGRILRIRPKT